MPCPRVIILCRSTHLELHLLSASPTYLELHLLSTARRSCGHAGPPPGPTFWSAGVHLPRLLPLCPTLSRSYPAGTNRLILHVSFLCSHPHPMVQRLLPTNLRHPPQVPPSSATITPRPLRLPCFPASRHCLCHPWLEFWPHPGPYITSSQPTSKCSPSNPHRCAFQHSIPPFSGPNPGKFGFFHRRFHYDPHECACRSSGRPVFPEQW